MIYLHIGNTKRSKKYTFSKGLQVLEGHEANLLANQETEQVHIVIFNPKDKDFGYTGEIELGKGHMGEFLTWLENRLMTDYPGDEDDIVDLIAILGTELARSTGVSKSKKKVKKEKRQLNLTVSPEAKRKGLRALVLTVSVSALLGLGGVLVTVVWPQIQAARSEQVTPPTSSFKTDLSQLTPNELGQKYPKKLPEIADFYVAEGDFKSLNVFNQLYPTLNGNFDLAFYEEKWETVVKSDVDDLSEERKVMLAHSFIMLNQLEEAVILNKQLKSDRLTEAIDAKILGKGLNLIHEKKLKEAKELTKQLQTSNSKASYQVYLDDADIIVQMIDLYVSKKDKENEEIWGRKLQDVGKEHGND